MKNKGLLPIKYLLISLTCTLTHFTTPSAFSQTPVIKGENAPPRNSLYGLTEEQVLDKFGKPDGVKEKQSGGKELIYGKSSVYINQNKVDAWSDLGDLGRRAQLGLQVKERSLEVKDDSRSGEWLNPWTPPKRR